MAVTVAGCENKVACSWCHAASVGMNLRANTVPLTRLVAPFVAAYSVYLATMTTTPRASVTSCVLVNVASRL